MFCKYIIIYIVLDMYIIRLIFYYLQISYAKQN